MVYIYVLILQQNKYYIGKTSNPQYRIEDHVNLQGSAWTTKYRPINIHQLIPDCDDFDEDKYTMKYMKEKGIENVRGGSFCEINLSVENYNTIQKMINGSTDKCFKCGIDGHFASNCYAKTKVNSNVIDNKAVDNEVIADGDAIDKVIAKVVVYQCGYCNREFDTEKGATFHQNMYCKKKNTKKNTEKNTKKNTKKNTQKKKDNSTNECRRCGRSGHYANKCYAKTDADGDYIDSSDDSDDDSY